MSLSPEFSPELKRIQDYIASFNKKMKSDGHAGAMEFAFVTLLHNTDLQDAVIAEKRRQAQRGYTPREANRRIMNELGHIITELRKSKVDQETLNIVLRTLGYETRTSMTTSPARVAVQKASSAPPTAEHEKKNKRLSEYNDAIETNMKELEKIKRSHTDVSLKIRQVSDTKSGQTQTKDMTIKVSKETAKKLTDVMGAYQKLTERDKVKQKAVMQYYADRVIGIIKLPEAKQTSAINALMKEITERAPLLTELPELKKKAEVEVAELTQKERNDLMAQRNVLKAAIKDTNHFVLLRTGKEVDDHEEILPIRETYKETRKAVLGVFGKDKVVSKNELATELKKALEAISVEATRNASFTAQDMKKEIGKVLDDFEKRGNKRWEVSVGKDEFQKHIAHLRKETGVGKQQLTQEKESKHHKRK